MEKLGKYGLIGVALVLAILMCSGAFAAEPYKVGGIFSATGRASFLGDPEKKSVEMLAEQINAAGGINGHPLEMIVYDDEGDATKSNIALKKLITKDKVLAVVGPSLSGTTLAIIPVAEKAKIPLVSAAASIKIVKPVKKWVFKTPQDDVLAVGAIYRYIVKKGVKKIAIITVQNGFGDSGRQQLIDQAKGAGLTVVANERFGPKDTDMTAQLTKMRGTDAEAIICWGTNPGPAVVAKNMKQLGIKIPLYQSHGVASKKFIELAGDAAEGIILPAGKLLIADQLPDSDPQKATLLKYKNDYEKKYGGSVSTFGGHAWDGLMLVIEALEKVGPDKAKIRDYIENKKGFVGTGGIFNFSPDDHNGLSLDALVMIQIKNGEWTMAP